MNQKKILIIEDDVEITDLIEINLEGTDYYKSTSTNATSLPFPPMTY